MSPRVSVIIPTYNRGGLLSAAVRSAIGQTYDDLEVIVADDGSTDGSVESIAALGLTRVKFLRLDHSGLLGVVRNAGARRAQGELLAFLDSDDVWHPAKIERQVEILDRNPAVGLVCSNASVIDESGDPIRERYLGPPSEGASGDVLLRLLDENFVIVSSVVVRRELFERAGRFSTDHRLRGVEDYDLWLRISAISEFAYLPDLLLSYREHDGSMRFGIGREIYWRSLLTAFDNLSRFLVNDGRGQVLLPRRRAQLLLALALSQAVDRRPLAAASSLCKAVRTDPATIASVLRSGRALQAAREATRGALRKAEPG